MSNMGASFAGNEFRMACKNTAVCHSRISLKETTKIEAFCKFGGPPHRRV